MKKTRTVTREDFIPIILSLQEFKDLCLAHPCFSEEYKDAEFALKRLAGLCEFYDINKPEDFIK